MTEVDFLQIWVDKVAELKNWPPANEWSNHQFQILSEEISNKSGILISRNTLRKLVTHLSQGYKHSPRTATKDAFAQYIGFDSWRQFEKSVEQQSNIPRKKNRLLWIIPTIFVLVFVVISLFYDADSQATIQDFDFEILNPVGNVPHTVECKYNFKNIVTDDIKVDFGHIDPTGKYLLVDLKKSDSIHKECFHYPGVYNVRLFIDETLVKARKVWINSNGWFSNVVDIRPYLLAVDVPDWLQKAGVRFEHIPFDAIIKPDITQEGYMHIPENAIEKLGYISKNFHTHFKHFKDFGVDLNNCDLSIRFKDSRFGSGTFCHEAAFYLEGENGKLGFKFAEEGCNKYTQQRIGNSYLSGEKNNLDYLILSYKEFTTVSIKSTPDSVYLSVDGNIRKVLPNAQNLGSLRGLHFWFKESPYIDFVRITDLEGTIVFSDEFEEL
jgi:hypothetical protein